MKKIYILPLLAASLLPAGCAKDNPFAGEEEMGKVLKSALDVSAAGDNVTITQTKAAADDEFDLDQFNISFQRTGDEIPYLSTKYGEMSDVVLLPEGKYTVTASYGEDRAAEWDNPYFKGVSKEFEVVANEITSSIDPVLCELSNVKVSIDFGLTLAQTMSEDSYVEVHVGQNTASSLNYDLTTRGKAGYFKYSGETTLVATFHGIIDGSEITETKTFDNVRSGCWYKITFTLHSHEGDTSGDADGGVTVEASVTVDNVNGDIDVAEDPDLGDSERPTEGEGDDPNPPTPPTPVVGGPTITAQGSIKFDVPNVLVDGDACVFNIHSDSEAGITEFTCDIDSPDLNEETLGDIGLGTHLDLVNTSDDVAAILTSDIIGFPVKVGGYKEIELSLTKFIGMIAGLCGDSPDNQHKFILTVTDANGTTTKTLILVCHQAE